MTFRDLVFWLAGATAFYLIALIALPQACGGEITYCRDSPGPGRWVYRIVQGHKCWFEADSNMRRGREKPLSELAWPKYGPDPAAWELEPRFKGDTR